MIRAKIGRNNGESRIFVKVWNVPFVYYRLKALGSGEWCFRRQSLHFPLSSNPEILKIFAEYEKFKRSRTNVKHSDEISQAIGALNEWMQFKGYGKSTIISYISCLNSLFGRVPVLSLEDIKENYFEKAIYTMQDYNHLSFTHQNQITSAFKLFCFVNDITTINYRSIERPLRGKKLPNIFSEEEVVKILRSVRNAKHQALLCVVYGGGLRISEALNLKIEDISSKERLIYINQAKGMKDRRIPLSKNMLSKLRACFCAYRPLTYVFEGVYPGKPLTYSSAAKVFKNALKRSGVNRKGTLHTLRHSYATHLLERGVGLRYIQNILGHNSPRTTMIYTHISGKKLNEIRSPLDDMDI